MPLMPVKEYMAYKRTHCITHRSGGKQQSKPIIAVDIETGLPGEETLGGSLVLGLWISEQSPDEEHWFASVEEWATAIFAKANRGCIWLAHNGGEYDYKYLLTYFREHKHEYPGLKIDLCCRSDGRIIAITLHYQKRRYELRDSYALITSSLAELTKTLAPEFLKHERSWTNADGTTNYFDPLDAEDRAYLLADVRGLLVGARVFYDTIYATFGVNASYTAGGTAMRAWRASLTPTAAYWRQRETVDAFAREAYKGGLIVFTDATEQHDMAHVDVNAMYAHAMRQGVPVGKATYTTVEMSDFPGIYRAEVAVPLDERYPFLNTNDMPSIKPRGEFTATFTSVELDYARSIGYDVRILEGYYFERMGHPFNAFIDRVEALERRDKYSAVGKSAKIMRNSLYGKFGTKPWATSFVLEETSEALPVIDPSSGQPVEGLFTLVEQIDEPYLQPAWAAFITAHARVHLARLARAVGAVYGDTDSVVFPRSRLDDAVATGVLSIGGAYGQVKLEAEYASFHAGGPKNYQAWTLAGKVVDKAKAVPSRSVKPDEHKRALAGEQIKVRYLGTNSTLSVLKRGAQYSEWRERSYSRLVNSNQWVQADDGSIWAVEVHRTRSSRQREGENGYA